MFIDERLAAKEFPLPAIREINLAMHSTGISLGLGELKQFPVHSKVIDALTESLHNEGANYTQNAGLPELREAIAKSQTVKDDKPYSLNHVTITVGVQNALYTTLKTLAKLGAKRVLVPEIHFGIYKKIPVDLNIEVLTYKLYPDFGIDVEYLLGIIKPDDLLIVNSPANPTGRVLSAPELISLAGLLEEKLTQGYVISDEIYDKLTYEGEQAPSISKWFNRTIIVNGISKSGAAAGLRVGWIITTNEKMSRAFTSTNSTIVSSPPTPNQYGAIPVVLNETRSSIVSYNNTLITNRNKVVNALTKLEIPFVLPTGSFYIFPNVEKFTGPNAKAFCLQAAKKESGVVVIPGAAFGAPAHIRISLATHKMDEALERLVRLLLEFQNSNA